MSIATSAGWRSPARSRYCRNRRSNAMRAVVQRVSEARVAVDNKIVGEISRGLLVLVGVGHEDNQASA